MGTAANQWNEQKVAIAKASARYAELANNKRIPYVQNRCQICPIKNRSKIEPCEQAGQNDIVHPTFFHQSDFPFEHTTLTKSLFYTHMDMRPFNNAVHKSHQAYMTEGAIAEDTGVYENGVNGVGMMFVPDKCQSYSTFEDVSFPPFHIFKNTADNLIKNVKGERFSKKTTINEMSENKCSWNPRNKPTFILSVQQQEQLDAFTNCMVIPSGCRDKNVITNPFQQTGHLNGSQKIHFVCSYLPTFLGLLDNYPNEYRIFFCMYGEDINSLLNPEINRDEIEILTLRIRELASIHEGLFPTGDNI